jgi:hypothetical protein
MTSHRLLPSSTLAAVVVLLATSAGTRLQASSTFEQLAFGWNVSTTGDATGYSVAALGDVNGDGYADLAIGAPFDDDGGTDSGTLYIVDGFGAAILHEVHGSAGQELGTAVANAGDIDGDGVDDVIVGLPGFDTIIFPFGVTIDTGAFRVYSGATAGYIFGAAGPAAGARLGTAVAGVGDTNASGVPDVLAGAPQWAADRGYVVLYEGLTHALLDEWGASGANGDMLGYSLTGLGDLDGNGFANFAMGAPFDDHGFLPTIVDAGRVDVWDGSGSFNYTLQGLAATENFGYSLAGPGDSDDDGKLEFLIGAPGNSNGAGDVKLYEGPSGTWALTFQGLNSYAVDERFGTTVAWPGDVNKDGWEDMVGAAPMVGVGSAYAGYVLTFFGKDDTQYDHQFSLPQAGGGAMGMGFALSGRHDHNGDGWPELVASAPYYDAQASNTGLVFVCDYLWFQPNLGFQGPGSAKLEMYGTQLFSGGLADMRLKNAATNSSAWLLTSATQQPAAFKGGTLVPSVASGVLQKFTTDGLGKVVIEDVPGGGGPLSLYCQFLVKNPAYPQGWGLSNAIEVQLLP